MFYLLTADTWSKYWLTWTWEMPIIFRSVLNEFDSNKIDSNTKNLKNKKIDWINSWLNIQWWEWKFSKEKIRFTLKIIKKLFKVNWYQHLWIKEIIKILYKMEGRSKI